MGLSQNLLERYLNSLSKEQPIDPMRMTPALRASLRTGTRCVMHKWPLKAQTAFFKRLKENDYLNAVLASLPTANEQLLALNAHVGTIFMNFWTRIQTDLPAALDCILTKTWQKNKGENTALDEKDETEKRYVDVVHMVTKGLIENIEAGQLRDFAARFDKHSWLSSHFAQGDSDSMKLFQCFEKIRKRYKNKIHAQVSRKRKSEQLDESMEKTAKTAKLAAAARALQDSAEKHRTRESCHAHNRAFKEAVIFFA